MACYTHPDDPTNFHQRMTGDLGRAFNDLIKSAYFNYKGYLVERDKGGFHFRGKWYSTLGEIGDEIDRILDNNDNIPV